MASFTALYDACVLYPAPLRDLLMRLAMTDLFRARWSNDIHEEWMRNLLIDRPDLTRQQIERTRDLMNAHVRDCVVSGYGAGEQSAAAASPQQNAAAPGTPEFNPDINGDGAIDEIDVKLFGELIDGE